MAKYIDADLLRKEIEKERKSIDGLFTEGDNSFYDGQDDAYNHTLALIESLQQEQPSESLEEAANNHIRKVVDAAGHPGWDWTTQDIMDAFKAGAEWQKKRFEAEYELDWITDLKKDLYELGRKDEREQMMKEAVEGEICGRVYDHINVRFADGVCKYLEPKNISHIPADVSKYNIGDNVRIIIVKEGDEI